VPNDRPNFSFSEPIAGDLNNIFDLLKVAEPGPDTEIPWWPHRYHLPSRET